MANATNPILQTVRNPEQAITRHLTVAAGVTIYEGTLVSINASGEAIVAATNARIAGVAVQTYTAGEVATVNFNHTHKFIMSGAAATDVGLTAYASDNQTATTGANTAILGPIVDIDTDAVLVQMTLRA